ncbi:helix-turn-helix domain-containing protein [Aquipseudomonas ullengensis]|uniref:Helix-turn-helix domain-containing protein n=1 Tax=Aquipseudomonas ullengensis TaxID=2759166 RepID=A0A7W4LMM3_9GAMM|nr:helix-turn-helix domain-containing protein [Pseudomonas ullengensis]MBB2495953.1 helix-turn-helix domain-containing protein [Pseudomonas ullengensis]
MKYTPEAIHQALVERKAAVIGECIFLKVTGEVIGEYACSQYTSPQYDYPPPHSGSSRSFIVDDEGSPLALPEPLPITSPLAEVISISSAANVPAGSNAGRIARAVSNPLFHALQALRIEGIPTPWLDDIIFGAICGGPGIINGNLSVAYADVKKLLSLPEISVRMAAEYLLNHDHEPMSTRQLQRVVKAARFALRGVALHLERHPRILDSIGMMIDFDPLWPTASASADAIDAPLKPDADRRLQALEMRSQGIPIKETARRLGASKNTIKRWEQEALAA